MQTSLIHELVTREHWAEAASGLAKMPRAEAAQFLICLADHAQQKVFAALPVNVAAGLLAHFPYYLQYVLLHTRSTEDMRTILEELPSDERMQFFDELPEEAWQTLEEEIGEIEHGMPAKPAVSPQGLTLPASEVAKPAIRSTIPASKIQDGAQVQSTTSVQPAHAISTEAIIQARGVEKSFPQPDGHNVEIIAPLDLAIYPGTIVALLGASGSGKSTLLRMLSGLSQPSSGEVLWHGKALSQVVPNVAIVFQSFALFPWLTVQDNVEAPLVARGMEASERRRQALRAINTVGLKGFEEAFPKELSGGMKQRVGFARALAVQPEVLFMDEPFSALDVLTAENLRSELLDLWMEDRMDIKSIFIVTHNIEEAVFLADRIIVLDRNPARIRADFRIGLPQPRDRKSSEFVVYVDYIYKVMTSPSTAAPTPPPPGKTDQPARYPLLPHARPGGIAGLLEILDDSGGNEDLYHLAEKLLMEVDDLFPIIEAAVLLGFAELKEGDVNITPLGKKWAGADIETQKIMFREAALAHIRLFQQIDKILHEKSDHSIPLELFRDILDEHQSEAEIQRQLETVLGWGRYCELFNYDSAEQRLYLPQPEEPADDDNPEFPDQESQDQP